MSVKEIIERSDLDALLRRLSQLESFMPGSIKHCGQKSPDFIIEVASEKIGVEVTRSVCQEYVRALKLQARDFPHSWINLTHLVDRPRRRHTAEIRSSVLSGLLAPWKRVDESLIEWQTKVSRSLLAKRRVLNKPGYQIFEQNWLLIHDTPGLPDYPIDFELACQHLSQLFSTPASFKRDFDCVFVHSHLFLFRWMGGRLDYNYDKREGTV